MVQPRSAADIIVPGQVHDNDGVLPQEITAELPPEGGAALPSKKRRREGTEARKKRRREQQGGLCQLNLDELYIVRGFTFIMF
jgi:hypothetical protein